MPFPHEHDTTKNQWDCRACRAHKATEASAGLGDSSSNTFSGFPSTRCQVGVRFGTGESYSWGPW